MFERLSVIAQYLLPKRWLTELAGSFARKQAGGTTTAAVSYTHLRAHETVLDLVCRLLLEKKKTQITRNNKINQRTNKTLKEVRQTT